MNPLKTARLSFGLTVNKIAKKLGISQPAYSHLENGNPTVKKLAKICDKMNWQLIIEIKTLE